MYYLGKGLRFLARWAPGDLYRNALWSLGGVRVSKNAKLHTGIHISPGVTIDEDVSIGRWVTLGPQVTLCRGVSVRDFARLAYTIIGVNSEIESNVLFTGFQNSQMINIGSESYIGVGAILDWSGGISIGDFVHIAGPSTGLWTHSSVKQALAGHKLDNHRLKIVAPITIQDHVWIGGNCTIYPGVTIGHHSIVLPNSAVTRTVSPYMMVGGVPARVIRSVTLNGDGITNFRK